MKYIAHLPALLASVLLAACGTGEPGDTPLPAQEVETAEPIADAAPTPTATTAPSILAEVASASYSLDATHASLIWKVSHNDLSWYTARFTAFTAALDFNADDPAASSLTVTIDPGSVRTDHPSGPDWDTTLRNDEKWFNSGSFAAISYKSTGITLTGDNTGIINGDLSLLGITKQVPLDVTFNGVRNFDWYGTRDVIGFSGTAKLNRSDFGMTTLLPNIGDEVLISIEAEFLQDE